jgi:hypothetical protein
MITAIKTVHWEKGVWVSAGGYEYNLVLLAAVFGLTENGPGKWSVDGALGRSHWGDRLGARGSQCRSGRLGSSALRGRTRGGEGGGAPCGRPRARYRCLVADAGSARIHRTTNRA